MPMVTYLVSLAWQQVYLLIYLMQHTFICFTTCPQNCQQPSKAPHFK